MKDNKAALYFAVIVLGVLLGIVLIGGIVIGILNSNPKLKAKEISSNIKYTTSDEQETKDVVIDAENFSITKGDAAQVTDEQDQDYICPYIAERLITDADMEEILAKDWSSLPSDNIPQMMLNELYARHGYSFDNEDYQAYFESKQWYLDIGTYTTDMEEAAKTFSDIEAANADYLKDLR